MDSPGDTENDKYLEELSYKGYLFSKMLIYVIDEKKQLDADAIRKNEKLKLLVNLRLNYKIPLLILLTQSDNYCDILRKSPDNKNNWKIISEKKLYNNKTVLLEYINGLIEKEENKMKENHIIHAVLIEPNKVDITKEEKERIINNFTPIMNKIYDNANEEEKLDIIKSFTNTIESREAEIHEFLDNKIKISRPKHLIEIIKNELPNQYHIALNQIE